MSCGPFSLNYGGSTEAAALRQGTGVRSRTRRSAAHQISLLPIKSVCCPSNQFAAYGTSLLTILVVTDVCGTPITLSAAVLSVLLSSFQAFHCAMPYWMHHDDFTVC